MIFPSTVIADLTVSPTLSLSSQESQAEVRSARIPSLWSSPTYSGSPQTASGRLPPAAEAMSLS